jgi:sialic acid synthase SpsE
MSQIIIDMGSGNTCRNDKAIVKRMINELKAIDTGKHEIILKFQLFLNDGINVPLDHDVFDYAYKYGNEQGYKVTSSVADLESLKFLLQYDVPFVKIPNDRKLDWLIGEIPGKIPAYVSYGTFDEYDEFNRRKHEGITTLACVSKYPAEIKDYIDTFGLINYRCESILSNLMRVSDHTIGLDLFKKYKPMIWEKHYKLSDSTGLDAGEFAILPEELREIL